MSPIIYLIFVFFVVNWIRKYRRWRSKLPPGPPCIPIIGNWGQIDTTDTLVEYRRLRSLYGDVFCFVIGSQPTIVISGIDAIKDLLVLKGDALSDRPEIFIMRKLNKGLGILASNGDLWKEHRTFAIQTLKQLGNGEQNLESIIQFEIRQFFENIKTFSDTPFDPNSKSKYLNIGMLNVVTRLMFGKRFGENDKKFFETSGRRKEVNDEIVDILQEEIDARRLSLKDVSERDYVDSYIRTQKQESLNQETTFTDRQLVQTIRDFMVAGSDTTATAIRWALIHLIQYPHVQRKMREEIHQGLGTSTAPSIHDRSRLPYCEAAITESQRMNHAIPIPIPHGVKYDGDAANYEFWSFRGQAAKLWVTLRQKLRWAFGSLDGTSYLDTCIRLKWRQYTIPRGAMVMVNLDSVAKDPNIFPDPDLFDPNRFMREDGSFNNQKLIIPFSTGKRSCPGADIAKTELFLFLTALVQKYQILPVGNDLSEYKEATLVATNSPKPFKLQFIELKL